MKYLNKRVLYLFTIILIAIPIFGNLDVQVLRTWDETRNAVNALEMHESGNWLVTTFDKKPDLWNTKPPLLIWCQVFFMKLIGVGELAIRLPSAIAAFLTCIAILIFFTRYFKNDILGIISVLFLMTTSRYVSFHAIRTGDYDALLTLFTTTSAIFFFLYTEKKQPRFLYFFFISLTLGVYTKGIAGLLFLPAIGIYCLLQKQTLSLLKSKHFYLGIAVFLIPVITFYFLREHSMPGYFKAVRENEFGGRFLSVIEGHKQGFWFYYNRIINWDMDAWYLLIPCGILVGLYAKDEKLKRLTIFLTVLAISHFLLISKAQTKLEWYTVPEFPLLAMIAAVFIDLVYKLIKDVPYFEKNLKYNIAGILFLFVIIVGPYSKMVVRTYYSYEEPWDLGIYDPSYFLRNAIKTKQDLNNYKLLFEGDQSVPLVFYMHLLQNKKMNVSFGDYKTLVPGNLVIANQQHIKDYLVNNYGYEIVGNYNSVQLYKIKEK